MSAPPEVLVDTGAFSLGGELQWCMTGRHRRDGLVKVRVPAVGYALVHPSEIRERRPSRLTRREVARALALDVLDVGAAVALCPQYWGRGRKTIATRHVGAWAAAAGITPGIAMTTGGDA